MIDWRFAEALAVSRRSTLFSCYRNAKRRPPPLRIGQKKIDVLNELRYLLPMNDDILALDCFALNHGQARWVLQHLGLRAGDDDARLDNWLKYARRMGVPFWPNELGQGTGTNVVYRYWHMMELAVALALRAQGILPNDLLTLLVQHRELLREFYARAWLQRKSGLGEPIEVLVQGEDGPLRGSGTYLNLRLDYGPGGLLTYTEPKLIGPWEALQAALAKHDKVYPRPPLPLSDIAENLIELGAEAPEVRRGRP
jgi:hypothetical protein